MTTLAPGRRARLWYADGMAPTTHVGVVDQIEDTPRGLEAHITWDDGRHAVHNIRYLEDITDRDPATLIPGVMRPQAPPRAYIATDSEN
jgi:hypothetical protein